MWERKLITSTSPFRTAINTILNFIKTNEKLTSIILFISYITIVYTFARKFSFNILGIGTRSHLFLGNKKLNLTREEFQIAENCVINPNKIDETFDNIGGLDEVKECIEQHVLWPINNPELFQNDDDNYNNNNNNNNNNTIGLLLY
eukprot:Tbor_TRINITY_DN5377_c3_g1::TRINITY_DN5377_c3_g1_i11::g.4465::m.4465